MLVKRKRKQVWDANTEVAQIEKKFRKVDEIKMNVISQDHQKIKTQYCQLVDNYVEQIAN